MEIKENEYKISNEELGKIREIAGEIYKEMGSPVTNFLDKNLIINIYITLIISIPFPNIFEIFKKIEKNKDNELKFLYDDLINLKKENFSSKDFKKKIYAKYNYYEKAFKIRCKIQNFEYNYHNLGKDIANFIQAREFIKIQYNYISTKKIGDISCKICNTKWLKEENEECPTCKKENDIAMFVILSSFFNVISDMENFFNNLDKETENKLFDNWGKIKLFLKKQNKIKNNKNWYNKIKEYGKAQYNKIIKLDKENEINEKFLNFNKKYNLALTKDIEEIDLSDAKNINVETFFKDLNELDLYNCKKITFPQKHFNINNFKPNAPNLEIIKATNGFLKEINLDENFFKKLRILNLENNQIQCFKDLENLKKIKTLKLITLLGNPIEVNTEIYKLEEYLKDIEIRYDYRRLYIKYNIKYDDSSDEK